MALHKLQRIVLIAACYLINANATGQTCLDGYCFLATELKANGKVVKSFLGQGYRAFLTDVTLTEETIREVKFFLEENNGEILSFILTRSDPRLYDRLKQAGLLSMLYDKQSADPLLGIITTPTDRLFIFDEYDPRFLDPNRYILSYPSHEGSRNNGTQSDHLTLVRTPKGQTRAQGISTMNYLLKNKGRLPNFFETTTPYHYKNYIDSLNTITWYKAIAVKEGALLPKTSWKELPDLSSTGKIHVTSPILSPQKEGYQFSPDISTFTEINKGVIKLFHATPLPLDRELVMRLNFNHSITNDEASHDKHLHGSVAFGKDEQRGSYAEFDGQQHYIDFGIPSSMDFQAITISAWIRPDTLEGNRSIVGIGKVLSAKIREGRITFTTPSIKDHDTDSAIIQQGKWQHIAFVYQANKKVSFYYNGINVGNQPASNIAITPHSLLIGTNLWSEYYKGGLDDLRIWNRALNTDEIIRVYQSDIGPVEKNKFSTYWYLMITALFVFTFIFLMRKKEQKKLSIITHRTKEDHQAGIYLFGGFRLINQEGKNLTSEFSPKRKELFILVLLHTFLNNGISSKKMSEILWEGHSFESAKNNRSTQIKRIREILSDNTGISIEYNDRIWQVKIEEGIYWDFAEYYQCKDAIGQVKQLAPLESAVRRLLTTINEGVLLPSMQYEWLDPIKYELVEEIIDTLTLLLENRNITLKPKLRLYLTNTMLKLDALNEKALKFKIKILVSEGKHTLARSTFDQFCHVYRQFYNEDYQSKFSSFL